ncbi:ATP-binding cassette domain-containing protein [Lactobacillus amylovorus]|uniref:ATP-binding cassette domain-containing protein n=1 Tax=Lactobacillus amylovorus TaxID=1604 RepID=A0A9X4A9V8_LACAM|nr:ATP-binding cassette domain-containing protein [Lactobacillus amylovorus]MDB6257305.1 ATP-binding cassette domain-containing protein [Lactobacillus amylovorus]MDB6263141.1 ATP-binding cassette domain-containing protein [Lactobacillus amylovorus]MDB6266118.1 ATP-binding cassette domain-containing protein [Lactobacillus amylovorus]
MLDVDNINIYYGKKEIINGASFTISPGEIVGLIGSNGAGKTTIMKTLLGLTKFTGKISFNDQEVTLNKHSALKSVGALIENPAIYPFLSGRDNLKLYSTDSKGMSKLITRLGMDSYIDRKAKDYSVGMKQKLGIALALLNNPQLVILDEPMNGLDIEATISIRKLIHEYAAQGTAFLISSHVLSELQKVMTSVIIINHGRIVMNSPMSRFTSKRSSKSKLQTTNLEQTTELLKQAKIPFDKKDDGLIIHNENIADIQQLLVDNKIWVNYLAPNDLTFEQKIVRVLQQERGGDSNEN